MKEQGNIELFIVIAPLIPCTPPSPVSPPVCRQLVYAFRYIIALFKHIQFVSQKTSLSSFFLHNFYLYISETVSSREFSLQFVTTAVIIELQWYSETNLGKSLEKLSYCVCWLGILIGQSLVIPNIKKGA